MQRARERWSADRVATLGVAIFGLVTIATGAGRGFPVLGILMLLGGASWTSFLSLFNVQLLNQAPDWVRARVLAVSMLVFQGAVAGGSAVWGSAAKRVGVDKALLLAGIGAIATTGLGLFLRFPEGAIDLTPWNHWRTPASPGESDLERPVLVTVEYEVEPGSETEFMRLIHDYGRIRRRDGASRWGVCRDLEAPDRYLETFIVGSWAEHLRQHDRLTRADNEIEAQLRNCVIAVQDKPGRDERSLKAGRLGSGIERFQGEVSMSGFCEPVQVIRE
jgi:Transmembrane secretion effector